MPTVETTTYRVETVYAVRDEASRGLSEIDRHADRAGKSVGGLRESLGGIGALLLGGAGIGMAKKAFIDFNSQVQDTKSQIAGMLGLASKTSFVDNIQRADVLFTNLQRRAASLPGTTQEYATMMGMITQPVINAGLGMKNLEDLTVNSVVAAKALRVEAGAAARDIDQALRGQYHSVDVFTGKLLGSLGYAGEAGRAKFNAMDSAKRANELMRAIMQPQIAEMAAAQGASFTGIMSTLQDNIQQLGGRFGAPLFRVVTKEIQEWNTWLDKNSVKIDRIVENVGKHLVQGFEAVKSVMAWIVDHSDILLSIGKVWMASKIAGGLGGSTTLGAIGGMFSGKATGASEGTIGGLLAVGTASYMLTTELMKLTGASDALLMMIDPQRAKYEQLTKSMQEWDDALAESRKALSTRTGASATANYANAMGVAAIYREQAEVMKDLIRERITKFSGDSSTDRYSKALGRLRSAKMDPEEIDKFMSGSPVERMAMYAQRAQRADTVGGRADQAAIIATSYFNKVVGELTESQKAAIDKDRSMQKLVEVTIRLLSQNKIGDMDYLLARSIILGEKQDTLGQAKPNITNINIARVEVPAKDPDKWISDLDDYARSQVKAPRQARAAQRR